MKYRTEKDSMGELQVPAGAKYAAQTQRALNNFQISSLTLPAAFIRAIARIKKAAARANRELGLLSEAKASAISDAADQILAGEHADQFPIDVFQTGSGTSTNMNVNEVLAHLASEASGVDIHPNDDVNLGQSSNDVIPSAIHLSATLALTEELLPALEHLEKTIRHKGHMLHDVIKTGRTHLMDAMPLSMEQELGGWAEQIKWSSQRLHSCLPRLRMLAQGGTAIGTGINAHPQFAKLVCQQLTEETSNDFSPSDSFFASISSQDIAAELSGHLKALACGIMKISNDLRWMNSGPLAGLGEIELKALQPGSSIMPGKINPVIPEATCMAAAQVIGNDATITVAAQAGNFQLNVMLPVIAYNLLQSIQLMSNSCRALADDAIAEFRVNEKHLQQALAKNPILVTALNPVIGYDAAAAIAKEAYASRRAILQVAKEKTELSEEKLAKLLDPARLTKGGISD